MELLHIIKRCWNLVVVQSIAKLLKLKDSTKLSTGAYGEKQAAIYLKQQGYRILQRNYRCKLGEIDLVVKDGSTLVFVEVKTRHQGGKELPEVAVNASKRHKLCRAAKKFMQQYKIKDVLFRFDIIAIKINDQKECDISHWTNVIDYQKSLRRRF